MILLPQIAALTVLFFGAPLGEPEVMRDASDGMAHQMRHNAAVGKNDKRWGIEKGGPHYFVSPTEVEYLRSIVGEVRCLDKISNKYMVFTGVVVGSRNDQILTNRHSFIKAGREIDTAECIFTTRSKIPVRKQIVITRKPFEYGNRRNQEDRANDFAIVRLESPLEGVVPMPIAKYDIRVLPNDRVFIVSAQQLRMRRQIAQGEPIIQEAIVRDQEDVESGDASVYYAEGSSTGGSSGSLVFRRGAKNTFEAIGIIQGSSPPDKDNQPYDVESGNVVLFIGFDGAFDLAIDRVSAAGS